jgi:flavin reductase (DIM6/NTAB) family NADH-FMN oxidoreductase RutF
MTEQGSQALLELDTRHPIWERVHVVAPLVLVGTREEDGSFDLAPKHMVMAIGWDNYFGFVCTEEHRTYHNAKREGVFTVSYVRPSQVVLASLAAAPRCADESKPSLGALDTFPAKSVDGIHLTDGYLHLECQLDRILDDFGHNSLVIGQIVKAQVHPDAVRSPDRDDGDVIRDVPLLAYLHPGRYATVEESFAFPYSQDLSSDS